MVFTLYAAKTQYFKAKAGLGRKIVGPLQRQANERSRRPLVCTKKKINNDETNQTISPRRVPPDGRRRHPEQLYER